MQVPPPAMPAFHMGTRLFPNCTTSNTLRRAVEDVLHLGSATYVGNPVEALVSWLPPGPALTNEPFAE